MNKGKIALRTFLILLFIALVALLVVALTDVYHVPKIEKYVFIIGIGLLTVAGFLRKEFKGNNKGASEK